MSNPQRGKCINFGNCSKANSQEIIAIIGYQANCPECGLPLVPYQLRRSVPLLLVALLLAGGLAGWGVVYMIQQAFSSITPEDAQVYPNNPSQTCTPLPLENKKTLYRRVLTKPSAHKTLELGVSDELPVELFSRYYVYEQRSFNNEEWLNIGSNIHCQKDGWVRVKDTIPWKNQISLTLTNPANRNRAAFYGNKENAATRSGTPIASEPERYVDPEKNFYLLPVLEFERRDNNLLLKVASATLDPKTKSSDQDKPDDLAIVFVVDTTVSMKTYFVEVKKAVNKVYEDFHNSNYKGHIKFGFIAFRSNIKATPKLEYDTKIFVDPNIPEQQQNFLAIVDRDVKEAEVSSAEFDEDSYAGVLAAINQIDWEPFVGRNIVLVTDAGALEPHQTLPDGSQISQIEDFTSQTIRELAQLTKDINVYAFHLKTEAGRRYNDHNKAKRQYTELTYNEITKGSLYYPHEVDADQPKLFGETLTCIVRRISVEMVKSLEYADVPGESFNAEYCPQTPLELAKPEFGKVKDKARSDQLLLGRALRLKYQGLVEGATLPDIFEAWISNDALKANILLSRDELSSLAEKLQAILDSDAESKGGSGSQAQQFFKQLKKKASILLNDPKRLGDEDMTVGELLNLQELEDLPYKSHIMHINEAEWAGLRLGQKEEIFRELSAHLQFYRQREATPSAWQKLTEETHSNDEVTLIPLELLP